MQATHRRSGAKHGGLFLAAVFVVAVVLPPLAWPWYLLLPLLLYAVIVLALPGLRTTAPSIQAGRWGGAPLACAAILSLATTAVLVGFHFWVRPDVTELADQLPVSAFGNVLVAASCFSVVNAALEEIIFHGVLWGALVDEWNRGVALAVTSICFGLGHWHGYPPGPLGASLAGAYGLALGLLRWWTGGLALTVGCHVCADATIFLLLVWSPKEGIAPHRAHEHVTSCSS
jgi:membrane protease YdiL (CAAX protease family)